MIKFSLRCDADHTFETWFSKSGDFDDQKARGLVTCPQCGSHAIEKALMAPSLGKSSRKGSLALNPEKVAQIAKLKELVSEIKANSEDVGERFPEEARKIHYGEADRRGIVGKADEKEAKALIDEGIAIAALPHFPDDAN